MLQPWQRPRRGSQEVPGTEAETSMPLLQGSCAPLSLTLVLEAPGAPKAGMLLIQLGLGKSMAHSAVPRQFMSQGAPAIPSGPHQHGNSSPLPNVNSVPQQNGNKVDYNRLLATCEGLSLKAFVDSKLQGSGAHMSASQPLPPAPGPGGYSSTSLPHAHSTHSLPLQHTVIMPERGWLRQGSGLPEPAAQAPAVSSSYPTIPGGFSSQPLPQLPGVHHASSDVRQQDQLTRPGNNNTQQQHGAHGTNPTGAPRVLKPQQQIQQRPEPQPQPQPQQRPEPQPQPQQQPRRHAQAVPEPVPVHASAPLPAPASHAAAPQVVKVPLPARHPWLLPPDRCHHLGHDVLARYKPERKLGEGAFGVVGACVTHCCTGCYEGVL